MIKINLKPDVKDDIEEIFINDLKHAQTGPWKKLNDDKNKNFLIKKYPTVAKTLYSRGGLDEENLRKLLLADRDLMKNYMVTFEKDFKGKKLNKTKDLETWKQIFNFHAYAERIAAKKIMRKIRVDVCPYCNRMYTTVPENGRTRSPLDHYYPQSRYPYLALSLYNLVPCCDICNRKKLDLDTANEGEEILYPYMEEMGDDVVFRFKPGREIVQLLQGVSEDMDIIFEPQSTNDNIESKAQRQIDRLSLKELYQGHKGDVKDIIRAHYVYTPERIRLMIRHFPGLFKTADDVKSLIYMRNIRKESWGVMPLAKLTHDIDEQLTYKKH